MGEGQRRLLSIRFAPAETREVFLNAAWMANDADLFAEQFEPQRELLWSNFPQGLIHLSCISAALTLRQAEKANVAAAASTASRCWTPSAAA
jgi:GH15 family glucan-1,4-alpha-glucosidase